MSSAKWIDFAGDGGEFARNGPMMNIILEYLLDREAAFAYCIQFPEVRILARIAEDTHPHEAMFEAIWAKNEDNALVLLDCHKDDIEWDAVFISAADLGNVSIMRQLKPLCDDPDLNMAMVSAIQGNFPDLMEQLADWGANPVIDFQGHVCLRVVKKSVELGASNFDQMFVNAAMTGNLPVMRFVWGKSDRDGDSWGDEYSKIRTVLRTAMVSACIAGHLKVVRYLVGLGRVGRAQVNEGLVAAAAGGWPHVCDFLLHPPAGGPKWHVGPKYGQLAICAAAMNDRISVLRRLQRICEPGCKVGCQMGWWTVHTVNRALMLAAQRGRTGVAELLHAGAPGVPPAEDVDSMLAVAAEHFQLKSMCQAHSWGAADLELALEGTAPGTSPRALLEKWIAEAQ